MNTTAERGGGAAEISIDGEDLNAAISALQAQDFPTTHQGVLKWLAQHRPAQVAPAIEPAQEASEPQASQAEPPSRPNKGTSKLAHFVEPPVEAKRRRKPGRPLMIASWFPEVAETMADGTTLRIALAIHGLKLSANEMRSLYRNKTFKGLYQEARRRYLIENWGRSRPSLRAIFGRCL